MNNEGGALHFDADINNTKFLAKILASEQRAELFARNVVKSTESIDKAFGSLGDNLATGGFSRGIDAAEKRVSNFQTSTIKGNAVTATSFNNLADSISRGKLSSGVDSAKANLASLGRVAVNGNNAAGKSFQELANTAQDSGNRMTSVFTGLSGVIAGFLSIQAAKGFVDEIIKIRSEFEGLDVAFTTILKSKERADRLMSEVVQFAATTPFGLTEVAKSTKQLLAYGVAVGDIKDELNTLGNIAAGVSQPIGEIAYLYGTLKTQGRAYAMDIRQFTGRGIPIIQELATVLGVAKNEVMGLVEEGKVGFPEVQKAFQNMTGTGGAFFDLMQKQSLTTGGRISNLKDQIDLMFNSFGKSNSGIINAGISGIQSLVANYETVIDTITIMIATYGAYRAALALTAAFDKLSLNASAAKVAALNAELVAETNLNVVKKAVALQSGINAGASLTEAQAKAVNASATTILAAQENASLLRKNALAASSAFYTAKQELEIAVKARSGAAEIALMQTEVSRLAVKKAEATQLAVNAAAELRTVEAKVLNSAVTTRMTAIEGLRAIGLGIATKAQAIYNAALAAAPAAAATAALVGLGIVIWSLSQANKTATEAQERLNEVMSSAQGKRATEANKIREYIKLATDATLKDEERAKAIKKLNDISPEFLGGLNAANVATKEGSKLINEYLNQLDRKVIGELAYAEKSENIRRIIELRTKGTGAIDNWERVGSSLMNTFLPTSKGISGKDWLNDLTDGKSATQRIVEQKVKVLEDANKMIDSKYGNLVKEFQLKGLEDPGSSAAAASTKRTETFVRARIKFLEDERAGYELNSKAYRDHTAEINKLNEELTNAQGKLTTSQKKATSERLQALAAIDKAELKSKERTSSDTQEKIIKFQNEAEQLRKLAKAGKLGPGAFARIDNIEKTNTGTVRYDQETEDLIKQVNKQKEVYKNFEEFKTQVSEQEAKKRYDQELSEFPTFEQYLASNIDPLQSKVQNGGELTGSESNRLTKLLEIRDQFAAEETQRRNKEYAEAILAAQSLEEEISRIKIKYANIAIALGRDATNSRKESLLKERDAEINAAIDSAGQKSKIYQNLNTEIIQLTKKQAKAEIEVIEGLLSTAKDISPEMRASLENQLKYAKEILDTGSDKAYVTALKDQKSEIENQIKGNKLSNEELEKQKQKLIEINGLLEEQNKVADIAGKIGNAFGQISGSFNEMASALEETNPELAYTLEALGGIIEVGADAAKAVASFATGDIIGGITGTISAVAKLFSISSRVKKMNEEAKAEVQAYYDKAAAGEVEYQALLRERYRRLIEINAIGLKGISDQTKALKDQKKQIDKDFEDKLKQLQSQEKGQITGSTYTHGTWFRKAKTDYDYASLAGMNYDALEQLYTQGKLTEGARKLFEELRKLKEEGADVEAELKAAGDALNELVTGTNVDSLSKNIIDGLRAGKNGLKDVMGEYTTIIQDALLSTFKTEVVDEEMKGFYERLAKLAASDGELTAEEVIIAQDDYIATRGRIKKRFDTQQQITGIDFGGMGDPLIDTGGLADSLIDGLKKKKGDLKSIMEDYSSIIQSQLTDAFKKNVVDVELQGFYKRLQALTESDGKLTEEETKKAQADYIATRERIKAAYEASGILSDIASEEDNREYDSLSSQIVSSLRAGKSELQDVMNDYTTIIQDALLDGFKSSVIDVEMKAFYARLSALIASGGELSEEEIIDAQKDYIATRERIKKQFDAQQQITGITLTDDSQESGIVASVKSLSENTGVAIEGLLRGMYDYVKRIANNSGDSVSLSQQNEYMRQSIALQTEIRDHTRDTAGNTGTALIKLDTVAQKLDSLTTTIQTGRTSRDGGLSGVI